MSIDLVGISKTFGAFKALKNVTLHVPDGELVALLGPSGSGKTTLLRIIAGLESPDAGCDGRVLFNGEDMNTRPVSRRSVGFVFQHYALFRHMSVFENIAFGLRVAPRAKRYPRAEIDRRVRQLLHLVQLENMGNRLPSQLSGGQRQRVALARALAIEPSVLLLDEPFGSLDAKVREELRTWLRRLHDEIHMTSVFVTHDQEEALEVADRIVIMNAGAIEQEGTPEEVFHHPATEFVMDFIGHVNLFHGRRKGDEVVIGHAAPDPEEGEETQSTRVFVRPHQFDVSAQPDAFCSFKAMVERIHAAGPHAKLAMLSDSGERFFVQVSHERLRDLGIQAGGHLFVTPRELRVFEDGYGI